MATDNKNIDLLQKFIENEKNAKRWTIISVILFCLLAFAIMILAGKLKEQKNETEKQKSENERLKLQIAQTTLVKVDSTNDALTNRYNSQDTAYDSLQKITNSLLIALAELKKLNPAAIFFSKDTGVIDKVTQEKIKKLITPASIKEIKEKEIKYTVYIQYTKEFTEQAGKFQKTLQKEYVCPEPELIRTNSFDPAVHYFYISDRQEAIKLANLAGKEIRLPVKVSFLKMKTPKKQLELWLGKYQPKTTEQILKKYGVNKTVSQ